MKKHLLTVLVILLFMFGISIMLYPTLSNLYNEKHQSKAIADYVENVKNLNDEEYENILKEAAEYNALLASKKPASNYDNILNIDKSGIMAYIEIPKIKLKLPIYHGTSDAVLQIAVGHVQSTSFPIGGESTHSLLLGHRGLPSAKLFTSLDKLEEGDKFYIYFLDRKLVYKVDNIKVVLPEELDNIEIYEGKSYISLITCTPYGINTHRLVVRGYELDEDEIIQIEKEEKIEEVKTTNIDTLWLIIIIICIIITLFSIIFIVIMKRRKKDRGEK